MNHQYVIHIVWSQEDGAYLASTFELPGTIADGQTPQEALANLELVIQDWLEVAKEEGRDIPPPLTNEDLQNSQVEFDQRVQQHIDAEVRRAVNRVLVQLGKDQVTSRMFVRGVHENPLELAGGRRD